MERAKFDFYPLPFFNFKYLLTMNINFRTIKAFFRAVKKAYYSSFYYSNYRGKDDKILKEIKLTMGFFFESKDIPLYTLGVKDINYYILKDANTIKIKITLERPGLLIGKGGKTFNNLVKLLTQNLQMTTVTIDIEEWRFWY